MEEFNCRMMIEIVRYLKTYMRKMKALQGYAREAEKCERMANTRAQAEVAMRQSANRKPQRK